MQSDGRWLWKVIKHAIWGETAKWSMQSDMEVNICAVNHKSGRVYVWQSTKEGKDESKELDISLQILEIHQGRPITWWVAKRQEDHYPQYTVWWKRLYISYLRGGRTTLWVWWVRVKAVWYKQYVHPQYPVWWKRLKMEKHQKRNSKLESLSRWVRRKEDRRFWREMWESPDFRQFCVVWETMKLWSKVLESAQRAQTQAKVWKLQRNGGL